MRLFIACITILGMAGAALAMRMVPLCGCKPTSPVCGSDWKTYSSECSLVCDNRYTSDNPPVLIYNGPCEDLLPKPDPIPPYNPYQPLQSARYLQPMRIDGCS